MAIWQHRKRVLGLFSPRMRRNSYLGTSGQKSDPAIRSGDLDFLWDRRISTTAWRLLDIFDVLVLLRRTTLWPRPLTFWPWECFMYSASHVRPTYQFLLSFACRLLSYLNIWSHFRYLKQSLRMRSITWPVHRRSPKTTRNNFLTPNCLFTIQLLNLRFQIVIGTHNRHFLTRNDVIWRILRKYPSRGVGCSLIEEPPPLKNEHTSNPKSTAK